MENTGMIMLNRNRYMIILLGGIFFILAAPGPKGFQHD